MAGSTDSGVYEIYLFTCTCTKPVLVWYDMETDSGGWTVFLNRQQQDIQLDFNLTWDHYKAGFGSPYSEYYLGNEVLHQMTYSRFYTIRLEVDLPSGGYDFTTYQYFKVDSEYNRYYGCQYFVPTARFNGGILLSCTDVHNIEVTQVQLKLQPAICDTSFKTINLKDRNCGCADPER
ncbi:Angiopoietin-4 [Portunus trituberculatus]|uniref:Angiopoietin-4 n=1 Tax=Portunus trituberculatus TaxID=210409 RepID=A0A5B7FAF8_PORTR|nr:Angiopoietin-4 [Portunus trituberculatus]